MASMTEIIKSFFPSASREQVSDIVWTCTTFPFTTIEDKKDHIAIEAYYANQLQEVANKYGNDPEVAIEGCLNEMYDSYLKEEE